MQVRRRVRVELTTPADEIATRTTEVDIALTPLATPMEREGERPNFQNLGGIVCGLLAATAAMPLFPSAVITTANPRAGEVGRHSKRIVVVRAIDRSPNATGSVRGASPPKQAAISGCACLSTADDGSMPRVRFSAAQHGWRGVTGTGSPPPASKPAVEGVLGAHGPVRDAPGGTGLRGSGLLARGRGRGPQVGLSSSADEARCGAPLRSPGLRPHRHARPPRR